MERELEIIKDNIHEIILKYTGKSVDNFDRHLLCEEYNFRLADFLYILRDLDAMYQCSIYDMFAQNDYSILTINNLANLIYERIS